MLLQSGIKGLAVVGMQHVAKLVSGNCQLAIGSGSDQSRVQGDDALSGDAAAPAGLHAPQPQSGLGEAILLEQQPGLLVDSRKQLGSHSFLPLQCSLAGRQWQRPALQPDRILRLRWSLLHLLQSGKDPICLSLQKILNDRQGNGFGS